MLKGWECERCKHKWVPREKVYPRVCPKCKSPYWDTPKGSSRKHHTSSKPRWY